MNTEFKYRPDRDYKWEIHYSLTDPKSDWRLVREWCWSTFGHPGTDPETGVHSGWDYHGGWIKIRDDENMLLFKLKWS